MALDADTGAGDPLQGRCTLSRPTRRWTSAATGTASAIRAMHDPDTIITLEEIRIYDGDQLIFNGSDLSTYTVCTTAEQLEAAFAAVGSAAKDDR